MRGYLKKQKTALGNIARSDLEVVYEQTDISDLIDHPPKKKKIKKFLIPCNRIGLDSLEGRDKS